jgi:hypothetical protein
VNLNVNTTFDIDLVPQLQISCLDLLVCMSIRDNDHVSRSSSGSSPS